MLSKFQKYGKNLTSSEISLSSGNTPHSTGTPSNSKHHSLFMDYFRIATNTANIGMLTTQMEGVENIRKRTAAVEVFVAHVNAGL